MTQQPPPPGWEAPPPGWQQPYAQQPPDGQQPYGPPHGQQPYGGWIAPPAHKPGVVPLRPLALGDLYDGALKAIRQNPGSMIGLSLLVKTAFVAIPALVTVVLTLTGAIDLRVTSESRPFAQYAGQLFGQLAGFFLIGIVVHVVAGAVLGRRTRSAHAWALARPRLLPLLGLVLLSALIVGGPVLLVSAAIVAGFFVAHQLHIFALMVLLAVVAGIAFVAFVLFMSVKLRFATAVLMVEQLGPVASIRRSWQLTRGAFWRIFGIALLTGLVVGIAGAILGIPFTVLSVIGPLFWPDTQLGGALGLAGTYLATILVSSITGPFSAGVTVLQYVDQRIRLEGYDVQLIAATQHAPPGQ